MPARKKSVSKKAVKKTARNKAVSQKTAAKKIAKKTTASNSREAAVTQTDGPGVMGDTVERQMAEEALREERDFAESLFETSQAIVIVLDANGRIVRFNPFMEELSGYQLAEVKGKDWFDTFIPDDERTKIHALFECALKDTHTSGNINPILCKDGSERLIEWYDKTIKDEHGQTTGLLAVGLDITRRMQAECALREERDRAQRYLDTVEAIIVALDLEGRVTQLNRKGCEVLGYKEAELLGKNWFWTCLPQPESDDVLKKVFLKIVQGDLASAEYFENPVLNRHGEQRLIAWHNAYLRDGEGNIVGVLSSGEDITERKRTEDKTRELLQQNRELTQHLFQIQEEERQHIARELHDEFGQWLTAIQLDVQNITNRLQYPSPEIEASVASITHSANQIHNGLRGIIHNLRPDLLDELGLADSLRELINQWAEYNPDIECEFLLDDYVGNPGKSLGITIYRIVQEALTNITRHAQAQQVEVQLQCIPAESADKPDRLALSIEDDGRGVNARASEPGMGIRGMRERALSAGGTFSVNRAKTGNRGKGTRIEARFPVNSEYDE